jgi:disulfide bond formation protein DsbB
MLNLPDLSRLLMIPIGAMSGLAAACANKAGTLSIVIFTFIGLLFGFGMIWVSVKFERRFLIRGKHRFHPFVYLFIPFVWIFITWLGPVFLALIVFGHK